MGSKIKPISSTKTNHIFTFSSPGYDIFLDPNVKCRYTFSFTKSVGYTSKREVFPIEVIGKRMGLPLNFSMRTVTTTINGSSVTTSPHQYIRELVLLNVPLAASLNEVNGCQPLPENSAPTYKLKTVNHAMFVANAYTAYTQIDAELNDGVSYGDPAGVVTLANWGI